jgi:hypothetical protein
MAYRGKKINQIVHKRVWSFFKNDRGTDRGTAAKSPFVFVV